MIVLNVSSTASFSFVINPGIGWKQLSRLFDRQQAFSALRMRATRCLSWSDHCASQTRTSSGVSPSTALSRFVLTIVPYCIRCPIQRILPILIIFHRQDSAPHSSVVLLRWARCPPKKSSASSGNTTNVIIFLLSASRSLQVSLRTINNPY